MKADPIRGRFRSISTDTLVMPALAGLSILYSTHQLTYPFAFHVFHAARLTTNTLICCFLFGLVSHLSFSFSLLHQCRARSRSMLAMSLLRSCSLTTYILAFYLVRSHHALPYTRTLATFFVLSLLYQALRYNIHVAELTKHRETVLVLGTGREAQKTWRHLRIDCDQLVTCKGFVAESANRDAAPDIRSRTVCTIETLEPFLQHNAVDTLVLTATGPEDAAFAEEAKRIARESGSRLLCVQATAPHLPFLSWLYPAAEGYVELDRPDASRRAMAALKTLSDRALAGSALLLMLPVTLPLFLLYQLILGEFPLVNQPAYGCHRRPFKMWDLRVAPRQRQVAGDASSRLVAAQTKLVARVGHFLKMSGLSRAPRLWNVFAGDMSLVGPRPVLRSQAPLVGPATFLRRYIMRPGLSCPRPGHGQTEEDATLFYLEHWGLGLDWTIFTHSLKSRARRALLAVSAPLIPDHAPLAKPTQRT